jgi:hypothetical protein
MRRRWAAVAAIGVLIVVALSTVTVAWYNPWHLVALMPFGRPPVVALVTLPEADRPLVLGGRDVQDDRVQPAVVSHAQQ